MSAFRVMVVDDNEDHRFFIGRALRSIPDLDLEIDAVADGDIALSRLRAEAERTGGTRSHLVLLDLRMPRRSGLEVLGVMKQDPELRRIPVAILTSSGRQEDVHDAYDLGANSFVQKPTDPGQFRDLVVGVGHYWSSVATVPEPR